MIATMRPDIDNMDEYVRNTTARAFAVVASALGIPSLIPFLKAVCQSKKSWQARHTGIKIVQQVRPFRQSASQSALVLLKHVCLCARPSPLPPSAAALTSKWPLVSEMHTWYNSPPVPVTSIAGLCWNLPEHCLFQVAHFLKANQLL